MTQETKSNSPINDNQNQDPSTALDIYKAEASPEAKALILNEQIIGEHEGFVPEQTINTLVVIAQGEVGGLTQYRPDLVSTLSHENLMAVINTYAGYGHEASSELQISVSSIKEASAEGEGSTPDESGNDLKGHIILELTERLMDHGMEQEDRRQLMNAIEALATKEFLKLVTEEPMLLTVLSANVEEFESEGLRKRIRSLQQKIEEPVTEAKSTEDKEDKEN